MSSLMIILSMFLSTNMIVWHWVMYLGTNATKVRFYQNHHHQSLKATSVPDTIHCKGHPSNRIFTIIHWRLPWASVKNFIHPLVTVYSDAMNLPPFKFCTKTKQTTTNKQTNKKQEWLGNLARILTNSNSVSNPQKSVNFLWKNSTVNYIWVSRLFTLAHKSNELFSQPTENRNFIFFFFPYGVFWNFLIKKSPFLNKILELSSNKKMLVQHCQNVNCGVTDQGASAQSLLVFAVATAENCKTFPGLRQFLRTFGRCMLWCKHFKHPFSNLLFLTAQGIWRRRNWREKNKKGKSGWKKAKSPCLVLCEVLRNSLVLSMNISHSALLSL
jgi:hypothetical protein